MEKQLSLLGVSQSVIITERVEVSPSRISYKLKPDNEWGWEDLRDYVVDQVEEHFGLFPRDLPKEVSIMKSFKERFEGDAVRIVRAAYEVHKGYWGGAPIRLSRFARASDEWFARVILAQLPQEQSLF
jgi:hypothetical protein